MGVPAAGVGGEQHVLFQPEMKAPVRLPVPKQGSPRLASRSAAGTTQLLRYHQRLVVIARKQAERGISLHEGTCCPIALVRASSLARRAATPLPPRWCA